MIIVVFEGKYYRIFNHFDSYPALLGEMVVRVLKTVRLESTIECVGIILEAMRAALSEHYGYGEGPGRYSSEPDTMNIDKVASECPEWNYFICLDADEMGFFVRGLSPPVQTTGWTFLRIRTTQTQTLSFPRSQSRRQSDRHPPREAIPCREVTRAGCGSKTTL